MVREVGERGGHIDVLVGSFASIELKVEKEFSRSFAMFAKIFKVVE